MLRKSLPLIAAGILAASILGAYNIAFAQDVTSDPAKLDQGTNVISVSYTHLTLPTTPYV